MGRPVAALLALLAAGCVSASVHRLGNDLRPPRPPGAIEVLEETPARPFSVIAHIECHTRTVFDDVEDLRQRLVEEAADLGGDALILGRPSTELHPIFVGTAMIMSEEATLEADVIVFDRPAPPELPPTPGAD